jgi:hypothetical protein
VFDRRPAYFDLAKFGGESVRNLCSVPAERDAADGLPLIKRANGLGESG